MRISHVLPLIGLLALGACHDEKKSENKTPPTTSSTTPATPTPATPANKPAQ